MPAKEHLPAGTAMKEDDCWMLLVGIGVGRKKELAVEAQAIGGREQDWLGNDERAGRKVGGNGGGG
jgi:hypothetical protein